MLVLAALVFASGFTPRVAWEQVAHPATPALAQSQSDSQRVSVTHVADGDTIDISPRAEGRTRVRLIGVDTPDVVDAQELARSTHVRLIDGRELGKWLEGLRKSGK